MPVGLSYTVPGFYDVLGEVGCTLPRRYQIKQFSAIF